MISRDDVIVLEGARRAAPAHLVRRITELLDRLSTPGPDDWRTPPGAPAREGCPVEELPTKRGTFLRAWMDNGSDGEDETILYVSERDGKLWHHFGRFREASHRRIVAWRPAAEGPGKTVGS